MPIYGPIPDVSDGDTFPTIYWNQYIAANINKLTQQQHRVVTVAQFAALLGLEDGDEVYLEVDAGNDVQWHLRYLASSGHWRFLGGPGLRSVVATDETTTSAAYAALTTAGPTVTCPRAGTYDVMIGCYQGESATGTPISFMSYDIGATGAVDADGLKQHQNGAGGTMATTIRRKTGIAASTALTSKYKTDSGTVHFTLRSLEVKPVFIT